MKREKVNKKQLAAAAFAVFFLIMAVCTAVSRAAASMVVPKVTTGKVQEAKAEHSHTGKRNGGQNQRRKPAFPSDRTACRKNSSDRHGGEEREMFCCSMIRTICRKG